MKRVAEGEESGDDGIGEENDNENDNDAAIADLFIDRIMEKRRLKRKKILKSLQNMNESKNKKSSHNNNSNSNKNKKKNGDDDENNPWIPDQLPMDKQFKSIRTGTNDSPESFCFACSYLREGNVPSGKLTELEDLVIAMGTELTTTSFYQHCWNLRMQYKEKIQKKVNDDILRKNPKAKFGIGPGYLLPDWTVEMIKEHIEGHHNDPQLTTELLMHRLKAGINLIWAESLIEKRLLDPEHYSSSISSHSSSHEATSLSTSTNSSSLAITRPNSSSSSNSNNKNSSSRSNQTVLRQEAELLGMDGEDEPLLDGEGENENDDHVTSLPTQEQFKYVKRVNPEQWKIMKEMTETWMKLGKSRPDTMVPFYKKDRYVVEARAKHPYFDTSTKIVYSGKEAFHDKNNSSSAAAASINFSF